MCDEQVKHIGPVRREQGKLKKKQLLLLLQFEQPQFFFVLEKVTQTNRKLSPHRKHTICWINTQQSINRGHLNLEKSLYIYIFS